MIFRVNYGKHEILTWYSAGIVGKVGDIVRFLFRINSY